MSEPIDIRVELTNLLAQVDTATAITTEEMGAVQSYLGQLYEQHTGDEKSLTLISDAWTHIQAVAQVNSELTFQVIASTNMTQAALEEAKTEREARVDLEVALEEGDEDDPRLQSFAENVRQDEREYVEENLMEYAYSDAMEQAYDDSLEQFSDRIQTVTGCDWRAAHAFLDVLYANTEPSAYQLQMFKELMADFDREVRVKDAQRGA
jgi:hypothetical protein